MSVLSALSVLFALNVIAGLVMGPAAAQAFRSGVELLALDVTVVDHTGAPVSGLSAADFDVTVEGAPGIVRTIDYRSFGTGAAAGGTIQPAAGIATDGRDIVFLVDDLSYASRPGLALTAGVKRMLSSLDPRDRVGLLVSSRKVPPIAPTTDRARLAKALDAVRPQLDDLSAPFLITAQEAQQIDRGLIRNTLIDVANRECSIANIPMYLCTEQIQDAARRVVQVRKHVMEIQVDALRASIALMKSLPEPRVLVVLSDGMMADPENNLASQLEAVSTAAAASGVQLYALVDTADSVDARDTTSDRARARRANADLLARGVQTFASAAGGESFRVVGTPDRLLTRVLTETSAGYRLGVEVTPLASQQKFLSAHVSVKRSDLTVRVRSRVLNRPDDHRQPTMVPRGLRGPEGR